MTRATKQPNISKTASAAVAMSLLGLTPMRLHLALQERRAASPCAHIEAATANSRLMPQAFDKQHEEYRLGLGRPGILEMEHQTYVG